MPVKADKLCEMVKSAKKFSMCDACKKRPKDGVLYPVGPRDKLRLLCVNCYKLSLQGKLEA